MPPAFVLSQDQTLRKNKFLSDKSDSSLFLLRSPSPKKEENSRSLFWFSSFYCSKFFSVPSHDSVFKQLSIPAELRDVYFSTLFPFVKSIFDFFRKFLPPAIEISSRPLSRRVRFTIAQVFPLSNRNPNFFRIFFRSRPCPSAPRGLPFRGAWSLI